MKVAAQLTERELQNLVSDIQEVLWPTGDEERQWSPDTLDEIAFLMVNHNLHRLVPLRARTSFVQTGG